MIRAAGVLALALAVAISSGCGYSLAGRGSYLPSHIQRIGVPVFVNRTTVFNLENQITEKVRAELIGRGRYVIVPDATGVDAVLSGEVTSVRPDVASLNPQQIATRYTVTMTARVELRDTRDNSVIWEGQNLFFRQEYDAQTGTSALDPAAFFAQDLNALERMTTDFAQTIVSALLEAF